MIVSPGVTKDVILCSHSLSGSTYPASRTFSAVVVAQGTHRITVELKCVDAAVSTGDSALIVQR